MKRLVLIFATGATSLACSLFDGTECNDGKNPFSSLSLPPARFAERWEITPDSGLVAAEYPRYRAIDAGPDARVWVELGTAEEWLATPCLEACRKAADLGMLQSDNATTSCATGREVLGKPTIECHYAVRVCTETRY